MVNRTNALVAVFAAVLMLSGILVAILPIGSESEAVPNEIDPLIKDASYESIAQVLVAFYGTLIVQDDGDDGDGYNNHLSFELSGTGFVILFEDELVLMTNAHVVTLPGPTVEIKGITYSVELYEFKVRFYCNFDYEEERTHEMTVIEDYVDFSNDIAIMFFDENDNIDVPYLEFGNRNSLNYRDTVFTVGNSNGAGLNFSSGTVLSVSTSTTSWNTGKSINVISIRLGIYPGNSGGPLMTEDGLVIGIVSAGLFISGSQSSVVAYAVPVDTIMKFLTAVSN